MSAKGAKTETQSDSEDALKSQGPSQKKLSPEAKRISKILENCISKIEIAANLPTLPQLNSVSSVVDKALSRALQEHQVLLQRLETLEGLKQESDGEQAGKERAQFERDIKNSVRDLLRFVQFHPNATCSTNAELGMEFGESECTLIRGLKKFHSQVVEKLLTSMDEKLQPVSSSPACNMEHIVPEEAEVATALKHMDTMISQKNEEIEHLHSLLQKNSQKAASCLLAGNQYQPQINTSNMKHTGKQQEIDELNSQFNNLILKNREEERVLQQQNEKVETEIEYLLQMFDNEIEVIQANLDLARMDYEKNEEELRKLEKPFSVLEMECNQIQEKRRLAEEKRREEMRELELKTKAALYAQAWWRGYRTRKALKNKGKSKKAKKGKGKKSK